MKTQLFKILLLTLVLLPIASPAQTKPKVIACPEVDRGEPEHMGTGTINDPYYYAEPMPEFPGGPTALASFFSDHLLWPKPALRSRIQGKVYVRFIVDQQGQAVKPSVVKGLGYGCDEEALRLVKLLPRFTPGKVRKKPVAVYYVTSVRFVLQQPN